MESAGHECWVYYAEGTWRVPGGIAAEAVWPCPVSCRIQPRLGGNPSPPVSQRLEGALLSLTSLPFTS